jgi:TonB family protein
MKNIILLFIVTICFQFSYSQTENAVNYYKKGTKALESKKYQEAISLLTLSINENPNANAYFNRSIAYYYLGDSCGFCNDLQNASQLKDQQALNLFAEKCIYSTMCNRVPDSIKIKYPQVSQLKIVYHKCNEDSIILAVVETEALTKTYELSDLEDANLEADSLPVFTIVEEMPEYIGGQKARIQHIADNIHYPAAAREMGIHGTVFVSFIVEADGSLSNIKTLRGIGYGCDEEAMRVVRLMPKWNPGRQNGKNVRVLFNMPISFVLQG